MLNNNILRDLGDGLVLKQSTLEDLDRLAKYNVQNLSDDPNDPEEVLEHWTRDLMTKHPTAGPGDFTYVEDSKTGEVVSSICLIPQTWTYEDIPFEVGRYEMVSTHRDYRKKGLVRAQFEILHQWSQERGQMLCAITGIPYFYRQFGYEMTMALGGSRRGYKPNLPKLKEDETEPYTIREARPVDIPFISKMYDRGRKRSLFSCQRDEAVWRYEMLEQHESFRGVMGIIETQDGKPIGFLWRGRKLWNSGIEVFCYELDSGVQWASVTPSVIRHLQSVGEDLASKDEKKTWESYTFELGTTHPAYDVAAKHLPEEHKPYAWYIRIPDLPDFIQHISPVLERRLAASEHAGYSGELALDFHRDGLKMTFEDGRITAVESWQPSTEDRGALGFTDLSFLHMVCGYRSFQELRDFYADVYASSKKTPEAPALIDILFPVKTSTVLGMV